MSYANWFTRAAAFVVDALIVVAAIAVVRISGVAEDPGAASNIAAFAVIGVAGVNRWYFGGKTGQTLGRRLLGIKLVYDRGGFPIGVLSAFLRDLTHAVDSLTLYIGWLFPLWHAKRQTFADQITGTVVVKA